MCRRFICDAWAKYRMGSTNLGAKINVEGCSRSRGNHAIPRARTSSAMLDCKTRLPSYMSVQHFSFNHSKYCKHSFPLRRGHLPRSRDRRTVLHCAHRATTVDIIVPSKLACLSSLGRATMLVYVWPSNEALLRERVPGAQDEPGGLSNHFDRGALANKKDGLAAPSPPPSSSIALHEGGLGWSPTAHVE